MATGWNCRGGQPGCHNCVFAGRLGKINLCGKGIFGTMVERYLSAVLSLEYVQLLPIQQRLHLKLRHLRILEAFFKDIF